MIRKSKKKTLMFNQDVNERDVESDVKTESYDEPAPTSDNQVDDELYKHRPVFDCVDTSKPKNSTYSSMSDGESLALGSESYKEMLYDKSEVTDIEQEAGLISVDDAMTKIKSEGKGHDAWHDEVADSRQTSVDIKS